MTEEQLNLMISTLVARAGYMRPDAGSTHCLFGEFDAT